MSGAKVAKLAGAAVAVASTVEVVEMVRRITDGSAQHLWLLPTSIIAFAAGIAAFSVGRILEQP